MMRLRTLASIAVLSGLQFLTAPILAQTPAVAPANASPSFADWTNSLWATAHTNDESKFRALLERAPRSVPENPEAQRVLATAARLKENLATREIQRTQRRDELVTKITDAFAKNPNDAQLSDALRWSIEIQMLSPDREAALREPLLRDVITRSEKAARDAESRSDWLIASELFYRLHALTEERGGYKGDNQRLAQRLNMLRLYAPHRLWELRRERALADDPKKEFPAYNPVGLGYQDKLAGIDERMILRGLMKSADHVERIPLSTIVEGALTALRTMATTSDLRDAFDGLKDPALVGKFVAYLDKEIADLPKASNLPIDAIDDILERLRASNQATVALPWTAVLHEFGNGAVAELDDYSALIWPDDFRRFQRTTQGKVVGIGVQLEYDEQQRIRVVTPINGSPADRAGILSRDIIARVDGASTLGMSLDQAIDLITGPSSTEVTIGIDRPGADGAVQQLEFPIRRALINITTVRGWRRSGAGERDWDYFIDHDAGVGSVRLSQFTDTTTRDFDQAVSQMRAKGLQALILDLRYNPGGLLDEAVSMSRRFIDVEGGTIVLTRGQGGLMTEAPDRAVPSEATLADIPVVVLINENSASASEIVSGALRYYMHTGRPNNQPAIRGVVIGQRSFGKGSVQSLAQLAVNAMSKITVQYYFVPDDEKGERCVHRKPGAKEWGVMPDLSLEILPKQANDAITIRRNADVAKPGDPPPLPTKGPDGEDEPVSINPDDILAQGLDVQLEAALLITQAEIAKGRHIPEVHAER